MTLKQLVVCFLVALLGLPPYYDSPIYWLIIGWSAALLVIGYLVDRKHGKGSFRID